MMHTIASPNTMIPAVPTAPNVTIVNMANAINMIVKRINVIILNPPFIS